MKFLPLALTLLNGTARTRLTGLTTRAKSLAIIGSLAGISAFYLLVALTVVLAAEIGVVFACLTMSAIFGVAALVMFWYSTRRQRRRREARMESVALASSADTPVGATGVLLAQAFVKGFLKRS